MDLKEIKERMYGQKLYYCNDEILIKQDLQNRIKGIRC